VPALSLRIEFGSITSINLTQWLENLLNSPSQIISASFNQDIIKLCFLQASFEYEPWVYPWIDIYPQFRKSPSYYQKWHFYGR